MILMTNETTTNASLTANSNVINYPVTNLLDSRLTRVFRTDSNTTAEVVFDNVTAVAVTSICIANHNISSSVTTLKVQGNATDSWGAPSVDETLTYSSGIITKQFTGGSYRYWRIQVVDATNSDGYIQIGRAWVGVSYDMPGIGTTITHDKTSTSRKSTSVSGQTYLDKRYLYETVNTTFPVVSHAEKLEIFDTVFEQTDIGVPFFVTFDETGSDLGTMYVTLDDNGYRATLLINPAYYTIGITLIEEV
jgi:hypothetical protein